MIHVKVLDVLSSLLENPVDLKLALDVCREDLNKAQTELNHFHAEYGDVVPRRDWENLERMYQENLVKVLGNVLYESHILSKSKCITILSLLCFIWLY